MTRAHKEILSQNRDSLVENMNPEDVLNRLQSWKILSARDVTRIKEKQSIDTQNEALLDILQRKPDRAYGQFLAALRETEQEHVANIIEQRTTPRSASHPPAGGGRSGRNQPPPVLSFSDDETGAGGDEVTERRSNINTSTPLSQTRGHRGGTVEVGLSASNIEVDDNVQPSSVLRSRPRSRANRSVLTSNTSSRAEKLKSEINEEILETSLVELQNLRDVVESGITAQSIGARSKIIETLSALQKLRREIIDGYEGSVILLILCPSVKALDDLWRLCYSGQLKRMFCDAFVTTEMKEKFGVKSFSIDVTIKGESYMRCLRELKGMKKLVASRRSDPSMKENIFLHKSNDHQDKSPIISPKASPKPSRRPLSQPCRDWVYQSTPDALRSSSGVSSLTSCENSHQWSDCDDYDDDCGNDNDDLDDDSDANNDTGINSDNNDRSDELPE